MSTFTTTLQEAHLNLLKEIVLKSGEQEGAAYVLYGLADIKRDPWDLNQRRKIISHDVIEIPASEIRSASSHHITWSTNSFSSLLKKAKDNGLVPGIVHSHPNGFCGFSSQDDDNETKLFSMACNRNGQEALLASTVLTPKGGLITRLWSNPVKSSVSELTCIVGKRLGVHYDRQVSDINPTLERQALAFGSVLNEHLKRLRVGVVGCGGTGSAVAMLLARLGVGQLVLFDNDIVEITNLNRLHGATTQDASAMRPKVEVVAREVAKIGLATRVVAIKKWISDATCQDALKTCDVVFGCTDDHDGRMLLNRLAYFYIIPVIDMGLAIHVSKEETPRILDLSGRVTTLAPVPGSSCLICRGVIDPESARADQMRRFQPEEYEHQKKEGYIVGDEDPNPAVVTFTTETACMAVNQFLHILTGYRQLVRDSWQWTRRFHVMQDRPVGTFQDSDCPICSKDVYWGRGDTKPFLDRVG